MWNSKYIIGETVSVWLWKLQYLDNHLYHTHLKKKSDFRHEVVDLVSLNTIMLWFCSTWRREIILHFFLSDQF